MGRPTLYNDEIALQLAEILEQGNSISDACAMVGIAEPTYHQWMKRGSEGEAPYVELVELTRAARAKGRSQHVRAIRKARLTDWRAAAFFLERSDPANWGRKDALQTDVTTLGKALPAGAQVVLYIPDNGRDNGKHDSGDQAAIGATNGVPIEQR